MGSGMGPGGPGNESGGRPAGSMYGGDALTGRGATGISGYGSPGSGDNSVLGTSWSPGDVGYGMHKQSVDAQNRGLHGTIYDDSGTDISGNHGGLVGNIFGRDVEQKVSQAVEDALNGFFGPSDLSGFARANPIDTAKNPGTIFDLVTKEEIEGRYPTLGRQSQQFNETFRQYVGQESPSWGTYPGPPGHVSDGLAGNIGADFDAQIDFLNKRTDAVLDSMSPFDFAAMNPATGTFDYGEHRGLLQQGWDWGLNQLGYNTDRALPFRTYEDMQYKGGLDLTDAVGRRLASGTMRVNELGQVEQDPLGIVGEFVEAALAPMGPQLALNFAGLAMGGQVGSALANYVQPGAVTGLGFLETLGLQEDGGLFGLAADMHDIKQAGYGDFRAEGGYRGANGVVRPVEGFMYGGTHGDTGDNSIPGRNELPAVTQRQQPVMGTQQVTTPGYNRLDLVDENAVLSGMGTQGVYGAMGGGYTDLVRGGVTTMKPVAVGSRPTQGQTAAQTRQAIPVPGRTPAQPRQAIPTQKPANAFADGDFRSLHSAGFGEYPGMFTNDFAGTAT